MEPAGDEALQPGPSPDDFNAWRAPTSEDSYLWGVPAPAPEQDVETYQPPPPAALVGW